MKIIGINGSPRKNKNTAILLKKALEGAESCGAETDFIHLYDFEYKGCISCFACKLINGKSYGKCAFKDGLTPVLEKISDADAIILASPIYFESVTGNMRSFMERLLFPYQTYTDGYKSIFGRKIPTGFIYTMNVTVEQMNELGYAQGLKFSEMDLKRVFGYFESLVVNDTYQFDDYSKYVVTVFDGAKKAKVREKEFPVYCKKAYDLGAKFTQINL
ncbi:NADPH-dependent FMN reductase RutF [Clostridium pasteurianum DSM 525 = ATCC 6013]|uniref:NADPH-dependent FMN reductase n=1 Tax=Clostridium pasteurianum DSM 525 = ATCC 6013 TaxID=1262449 RepID=A0A0H3JAS3_CLOPA|nr:flavodoxin family protein [Clostridium pasteurianum]AJA48815.1 NADPH-dependent FMN reductase RutF [Clostridium pasteurianum DSM 525 = ATCC 6013]AJA52803.1 NADPH-dependent FMN reductase RutF [Clostridium pasteurianum DSM 525 = ATCC 6013]AOZ76028.1 flavodoxin [Clostridium pasteurianum DSM 525 = ATCC 6013]AOZ79824.1 flavodoxin [Clostridium pasteurianum]ELP60110.1 NADPH-dependent FMN reductase RutF [Clostridium pasteurianum DSM 525 = ATCC 6013]